jgi:putative NIF3 family GTP cyclohydrolase 1 type 2
MDEGSNSDHDDTDGAGMRSGMMEAARNGLVLESPAMAVTRRSFLLAGSGIVAADVGLRAATRSLADTAADAPPPRQGGLTAGQIIDRIKANVGVPWRTETVDKFVSGTPAVVVKGIATTMMATLDVVVRAAGEGRNLVITHEPTFYSHLDTTDTLQEDPTYKFKADFLRSHDMAVFRFHDHWHARRPDGIATGMARELGWEKQADPDQPRQFQFPGVPLSQLTRDIQTKLGVRAMRVIGDPNLVVKRVVANWGFTSPGPAMPAFARPRVDVMIIGAAREWELIEYAQDCNRTGQKKALVVLGHVVSEQSGMKYCAEWLKGFIPEVPIGLVAAEEPFWVQNPA